MFSQDEKLLLRILINKRLEELEVVIANLESISKTHYQMRQVEYNRLLEISEKLNSING